MWQEEGSNWELGVPLVPELRPQGLGVGSVRGPGLRLGGRPLRTGRCWEDEAAVKAYLSGLLSSSKALAPALPTVACLVHLGISDTSIRFVSSSGTFHSSPLPAGESLNPSASLQDPHVLRLNCSNETSPFSSPKPFGLSAFSASTHCGK